MEEWKEKKKKGVGGVESSFTCTILVEGYLGVKCVRVWFPSRPDGSVRHTAITMASLCILR